MKLLDEIKNINKYIKSSKSIFLMAHKNLDLDAIASTIGMCHILKSLNKECFIVIDDEIHEMGVEKVLREMDGCYNIIKSNQVKQHFHKRAHKNLLIILDTNKKDLLPNKEILNEFQKIIVIDHHDMGKTSIRNGIIVIDTESSSASELIVNLANYYNIEFTTYIATLLLAGITLDTNNFTLNTNEETFYIAYFLSAYGASNKKVQYLLKQDITKYSEQQKLLTNIEIVNKNIAIAKGTPHAIYRKEDLARIADTLLFFNDIDIAIVVGKTGKDIVGVSARSLDKNIEKLMDKLGGGGNKNNAGATLEKKRISEVVEKIKKILKEEEK